MIFNAGAIVAQMDLNTSRWKRGVASVLSDQGRLNRALTKIENKARSVALGFGMIGLAINAGFASTVAAAAQVEESENLFTVSMGKMTDSTRAWSEDLEDALGVSAVSVRKTVGTFNVMLGSMGLAEEASATMSKEFTKLTYDMSSFYNIDHEQAFQKLRGGLTGESEALKALGIVINEETVNAYAYANGIGTIGKKLSSQEKIVARYGAILEATALAQGDLHRTGTSTTNMFRRLTMGIHALKVRIGQALIPAVDELLFRLNRTVGFVRRWIEGNKEAFDTLVKIGAASGVAAVGIAAIATGVWGAVKAMKALRATAAITWAVISAPALPVIAVRAAVAAAIAGIGAAIYTLRAVFKTEWDLMAKYMKLGMVEMTQPVVDYFKGWETGIKFLLKLFADQINSMIGGVEKMAEVAASLWKNKFSPEALGMDILRIAASKNKEYVSPDGGINWDEVKGIFNPVLDAGKASGATAIAAVKKQMAEDIAGLHAWLAKTFPESTAKIDGFIQGIKDAAVIPDSANFEGYAGFDPQALLAGARNEAAQAAASKQKEDALAKLAQRGRDLYQALVPTQDMFAQITENVEALKAAGKLDEAEGFLAVDVFEAFKDIGSDAIDSVIVRLRYLGGEGAKDAMRFADLLKDLNDKLKAEEEKLVKGNKLTKVADAVGGIGAAVGRLGPQFRIAAVASQVAAKVMAYAAAAAKGPWGWVELAINAVADALGVMGDKAEKELEGMGKVLDEIAQASEQWVDSITDSIVEFSRTGKTAWKDLVDTIITDIEKIALKELIVGPLIKAGGGLLGFSKGGAFMGGDLIPAKNGHVTNGPELFKFSGGQMGIRGEAGNEAIMPITRTASGKLGVSAEGGGVSVNVHNYGPQEIDVQERMTDDGRVLDIIVGAVKQGIGRGEFDQDFALNFGVQRG